jgi:trans-aconitate methyltransferase
MDSSQRRAHWENVYRTKAETEVSWFQEDPSPSLDLIALAGANRRSGVIDVGAGASRLVDRLLAEGYEDVTALDISEAALAAARARIGERASRARWLVADATTWTPSRAYDLWHDRATFHFLIDPADRDAYLARLRQALRVGGAVILAAFAPDGPERCSGLPVARYDAAGFAAALGPGFALIAARRLDHLTPAGATQRFQFAAFGRTG